MTSRNYHEKQQLCNIAGIASAVVNRILMRDQNLSGQLRSKGTGSHQVYREECITADMAAELIEHFPKQVRVTMFTPPEEKLSGSDWFWSFEKGGGSIRALVQAKRVRRNSSGEPDSDGVVQIDLSQLSQLENMAKQLAKSEPQLSGLQPWLVTFARTKATPPCGYSHLNDCRFHRHNATCLAEWINQPPSIWIAHARDLHGLKGTVSVREIVKRSIRMDCLLPCIGFGGVGDGPEEKGFYLQSREYSYESALAAIERNLSEMPTFQGAVRINVPLQ